MMTEGERLNGITETVTGSAIQIHKALGCRIWNPRMSIAWHMS